MSWLFITILSYFLYAFVALIDKYLLSGLLPNPKIYSFYVGVMGIWALTFIPFVNFVIPDLVTFALSFLSGVLFVFFLLGYYSALNLFEASRVVSAIGGFFPLFSFGLVYLFSFGKAVLTLPEIISFSLLVLGNILAVMEKNKAITYDIAKK